MPVKIIAGLNESRFDSSRAMYIQHNHFVSKIRCMRASTDPELLLFSCVSNA